VSGLDTSPTKPVCKGDCPPTRIKEPRKYVVGFLLVKGVNTVLLISKQKPAWQAGRLNGPGGKVEQGESFLQAMRREFEEEIQYAGIDAWEHFATLRGSEHDGDVYAVAFFRTEIHPSEAPHVIHPYFEYDERPEWVRTDPLPDAVLPNLRFLVPMAMYPMRDAWPYTLIEGAPNPQDNTPVADATGTP